MKTKYVKHFQEQLSKAQALTEESRQEMNEHRLRNHRPEDQLIDEDRVGHIKLMVGVYEKNESNPDKTNLSITIHSIWEDEVDDFLNKNGTYHIKSLKGIPFFANKKAKAYIEYLEECIDQKEHEKLVNEEYNEDE